MKRTKAQILEELKALKEQLEVYEKRYGGIAARKGHTEAFERPEYVMEHKGLDERLKKERESFFSVLWKAPYGVVLISRNGKYTFINEEFTNITGYAYEDVPDGSSWFRKAYPERAYRAKVIEAWKNDMTRKGVTQVFTVRCKDGKRKDIEFRPTVLEKGRYIVMLSDVTKRKKAEKVLQRARDELETRVSERTGELSNANRALQDEIMEREQIEESLRNRESQLSAIIEATDLQIYICSEDYRIEFMNEKLIERTGYDGTGMPCYRALHERVSVCPWCVNERVFRGETVRWEIQSPKDDRWYYIVNTPILNRNGTRSKYAMILDITDRKETEGKIGKLNLELQQRVSELKDANKELEAFSYSISHDLGTPLMAIEGFSKVLLEKYSHQIDEKGQRFLKAINTGANQLRELTKELLAFSHLGRRKIKLSNTNVEKIVTDILEQVREVHGKDNLKITVGCLPQVNCDRAMIRQVFANLIGNAVKYSRPRDIITLDIGGSRGGMENVYYVKDNGVGFHMDQAKRVFEVFERLHSQDEFEGTGIGLAIVKRVVERHGGKVWAESGVNEGATFYFSLPSG